MRRGVGIIGAGIGAEHLAAYRTLPALFEVRKICDLDLDRAIGIADGIAVTRNISDLLEDPHCDVIDICLPPHLHLPVACDVLAANKTVICEKPLVTSLIAMDKLEAAAKISTGRIFPVFQYRNGLGMSQLRALLASGLTGDGQVATLETHWSRDADYYNTGWRGTWAGERGGAVVTHAIHIHDLLTQAFGPIATVQASIATRVNPIETDDCAAILLNMQNGALVTSSVTLGAAEDHSRLRLVFEHLTAESDLAAYAPAAKSWRFTARRPEMQSRVNAVVAAVSPPPVGFAGFLTDVSNALDGTGQAVTLQEARASLELITAIYASDQTGCPQNLPINRDHPLYDGWQPKEHR